MPFTSKENLILWQERMFFACIFLLPIYFIPSIIEFPPIVQISHRAVIYPLLIGIILWILNLKLNKAQKVERYICIYFLIFLCWSIITSIIGSYKFPYRTDINIEPYSRFSSVLDFLLKPETRSIKSFQYIYSNEFIENCYMFIVSMIGQVYFISYALASLWAYSLFKNRFNEGIRLIQKAIVWSFVYLIPIGIIELFSIFGNLIAKSLLKNIFGLFYYGQIARGSGWWPPAQWNAPQIRLLWPEPSTMAEYVMLLMPTLLIWSLFKKRAKIISIVFFVFLTVFSFYNGSRTTYIVYTAIITLSFFITVLKLKRQQALFSLFLIFILFGLLVSLKIYFDKEKFTETSMLQTIKSLTDKNSRSNTARLACMISYWETAIKNPIFGTGFGFATAYFKDNCPHSARTNPEVIGWLNQFENKRELATPPPITLLLFRLAEIGFVGMIFFFFPLFLLLFYLRHQIFKHKFWAEDITDEMLFYIISLFACIIIISVNLYQTFEYYLIFVPFAFILIEEIKTGTSNLKTE